MPDSPFRIFPPLSGRFASSSLPSLLQLFPPFFLPPFFLSPPFLPSSNPKSQTLSFFNYPVAAPRIRAYLRKPGYPYSAPRPGKTLRPGSTLTVPPLRRSPEHFPPTRPPCPAHRPPKHPGHAVPPACLSPAATQPASTHKTRDPSFTVRVPPPLNNQTIMKLKSFPLSPKAVGYADAGKRPVPATGRTVSSAARDPNHKPFE